MPPRQGEGGGCGMWWRKEAASAKWGEKGTSKQQWRRKRRSQRGPAGWCWRMKADVGVQVACVYAVAGEKIINEESEMKNGSKSSDTVEENTISSKIRKHDGGFSFFDETQSGDPPTFGRVAIHFCRRNSCSGQRGERAAKLEKANGGWGASLNKEVVFTHGGALVGGGGGG